MGWAETLRTTLEALNGRRMRTLLTMLGILIGIAAVMLTVGLGEGAKKQIGTEIAKLGSNLLIVMPGSMSADGPGMRGGEPTMSLTLDDAALIADPNVAPRCRGCADGVHPGVRGTRNHRGAQRSRTNTLWQTVRSRTILTGVSSPGGGGQGGVGGGAWTHHRRGLFGGDPAVGNILVNHQRFTVIGVLEAVGSGSMTSGDDQIVVPLTSFAQRPR